jgi:hypothetical protein
MAPGKDALAAGRPGDVLFLTVAFIWEFFTRPW